MSKTSSKSAITKQETARFDELGVSGLRYTGNRGLIIEEFLPELSGERARRIYREMRDNDPVVGAIMYVIEMLIRNVTWRVEGDDEEVVEFLESCLLDMSHTWGDFLCEVLSMLTYGFSWHEIIYKQRQGESSDPTKRSRFDDGKIGWRKLPIRAQDTLSEWEFDDEGGVQAFVQQAPPKYQTVPIPIARSLLFRLGMHKGNPEGRSLLRNVYRPWYFKRKIENFEAIGIERDLAGLPVIKRSAEMAVAYDTELKKILRNVRNDEQAGLLLPLAYDENGKELLTFELLSSAGQKQMDVGKVIDRYSKTMAMTCLADFILLGQQAVGSFALSSDKTQLFATALGAIVNAIADVVNRIAVPRLLAVNGMQVKKLPELHPGDLESPNLAELGAYVTALAGAGAPLFPDIELENYLRKAAAFPEKSEEALAQPLPPKGQKPTPSSKIPEEG